MSSFPYIGKAGPSGASMAGPTATLHPVRIGVALAATVAIGYSICALLFWLFPEAAVNFMNALFHGLDFRLLRSAGASFTLGSFVYGLGVMIVWAFAMGIVFGWIERALQRAD